MRRSRPGRNDFKFALLCGASCLIAAKAGAQDPDTSIEQLKLLSIEELFELPVTSVSRSSQPLGHAASAVYVIRGDVIANSAYTSLPDLLRLAPNLHVAQRSANAYSITARGFRPDANTSNKLLVLVDGRTIYSPVFSGVFWDSQQVFLADLDRIEVISGPGGATWGANAVNGVINVISKTAAETQGVHAYAGVGETQEALVGARYGGKIGDGLHYRVYGMYNSWENSLAALGGRTTDGLYLWQGGFRADWTALDDNVITIQGDVYEGKYPELPYGQPTLEGGNLVGRWTHTISEDSEFYIQAYIDHADRDSPMQFADRVTTQDLEVQHRFHLQDHEITWGGNYRYIDENIRNHPGAAILPANASFSIGALFIQDTIQLRDDLRMTLGIKTEHHHQSGFDYQPTIRLSHQVKPNHTLWAAVSRAARTPARIDTDFHIPGTAPYLVEGGPDFDSEILQAFELGWRGNPNSNLAGAITVFYHDYSDLRSIDSSAVPWRFSNDVEAESYGVEASADWNVLDNLRLSLGYAYFQQDTKVKEGAVDFAQALSESSDPNHQFSLRANWTVSPRFNVWAALRFVDELPIYSGEGGRVPEYFELDAKISWQLSSNVELSLIGRNLLDEAHAESDPVTSRVLVERNVTAVVVWRH